MSEDIDQGMAMPEPAQSLVEAEREITNFLKALQEQIVFLKAVACAKELDKQNNDKRLAMAWSASWTAGSMP